jgi:hypothetical protein
MSDTLPDATFTLPLSKTINFDGREYTHITLQEPSVKTVLRADEHLRNGMMAHALRNREIYLVALTAAVPVPVVEAMRISDLNRALAYILPFLELGQKTGAS